MKRPTVCACYLEGNDPEYLKLSLDVMMTYPWITTAVVLHTNEEHRVPVQDGRVRHVYESLGYGFDKQPEEGGYDEVAGHNRVLELGRETKCDWLLVIHADDFFLPGTYDQIQIADRCGKDAIFFEYFHFYSPTQYILFKNVIRPLSLRSPAMHDPHIRAIRSNSNVHWELNEHEQFRKTWPNRTMHATPHGWNWAHAMCVPGMFHIHTRFMLEPKRSERIGKSMQIADLCLETVPAGINIFPQVYLDAYVPLEEGD